MHDKLKLHFLNGAVKTGNAIYIESEKDYHKHLFILTQILSANFAESVEILLRCCKNNLLGLSFQR